LRHGQPEKGLIVKCALMLEQHEKAQLVRELLQQRRLTSDDVTTIQQKLAFALQSPEIACEWRDDSKRSYIRLARMFVHHDVFSRHERLGTRGSRGNLKDFIERLLLPTDPIEAIMNDIDFWETPGGLSHVGAMFEQQFRTFAEFRSRPVPGKSQAIESFQGTETASVLLNLKNHPNPVQRKKYATICTEFSSFFPLLSIDAVEVTPSSGIADVQFLESGRTYPIPLGNVGAGLAEILTLITNLVGCNGYVFVVEEPESHLHPQAKRRLMQLIRASAMKNQVFVITHDPYFVDPDHMSSLTRFWITQAGTQQASIGKLLPPKELGKLKTAAKDVAKREMVFARALLLVEDESQQKIILGFAHTLASGLDAKGVSVVDVGGQDGFGAYIKFAETFKIPFLCLRDQDWGPPKAKPRKRFRALGCELEEFLENAGLGSLMEEAKTKVGTSKPRVAEYVGGSASVDQIPAFFRELLADAVKLAVGRE